MKTLTAAVLIFLTVIGRLPALAADNKTPEQTIRSVKEGRKIRMQLKDGRTLNGRRGKLSSESFALDSSDKQTATAQQVRFDEVESVRVSMNSAKKSLMIGGICFLALFVVGLAVGGRI